MSNIVFVDVDQFYGIEIEEFPAQIAQVALWMTDHQMNQLVSTEFGQYFARLPLRKSPHILFGPARGNALQIDWRALIAPEKLNYIVGNPPFKGKKEQTPAQKRELRNIFSDVSGAASLDYVACWYRKSVDFIQANPKIEVALVATNSITQGEQAGLLWPGLFRRGIVINFAHRTFQWTSEARGKAAVHCVIIGFSLLERDRKVIFEYETVRSSPIGIVASRINSYLVDAENIVLLKRRRPIQAIPKLSFGSMPNDDGNLLIETLEERNALIAQDAGLAPFVREFLGAEEFIANKPRYCLWLADATPTHLRSHFEIARRCDLVRKARSESKRAETKALAKTPAVFGENRQPESMYLAIPKTSSETRQYIPMAFLSPQVIASTELFTSTEAGLFGFGILTSQMHMAWVRSICGRLKSDYRYSAGIVYNNFPWPDPTPKQKTAIESAAQSVLNARAKHPDATLADLYDPLSMPPGLVKAHQTLDRAVDAAYGKTNFASEADRVAFLFTLYEKLTSLFPIEKKAKRTRRTA